ncbi:MAG: amylo-alpha-1,6-glucosidase [Bryobacteraceae bacterium]|nr:amylo-alpha-1,6-glucosidase [Bryobacteraceae bacterium]
MRIPADVCQDYAQSSTLEWLETNGTGAFAMGTISGANTRRYHGYLVAANGDRGRQVWLAKVDDEVNGIALGANQFPNTVHPDGYRYLADFALDPFPTWSYQIGDLLLRKSVFLVPGRPVCVVQYAASAPCTLVVRPFLAGRDYHALRQNGEHFIPPGLDLQAVGGTLVPEPAWWRDFEYPVERERGFDFREELYTPGRYAFLLRSFRPVALVASLEPDVKPDVPVWREQRRLRPLDPATDFDALRPDGRPTLIAGYPWFTDWGRDTMIALPGLAMGRGELAKARSIIDAFLAHLHQGLIPNRFPDAGETPEYNSVDATLWLIAAIAQLQTAGGDTSGLRERVEEIAGWLRRGTLYGIHVDPADGLLAAGDPTTNLTWMDARVDGHPVTPRDGKAVEINALWLNALHYLGDPGLAAATNAFQKKFWNGRYLDDCVGDSSLRPNQLLALSLPYLCVTPEQGRKMLDEVEAELLTPVGLRTLAPSDPAYQGRYAGGPAARDAAYHQGTVWPWLLGPYLAACLRLRPEAREDVAERLERWRAETRTGCLGHIAEIYEGDAPHRAVGAPAQAWSLAELLRLEACLMR